LSFLRWSGKPLSHPFKLFQNIINIMSIYIICPISIIQEFIITFILSNLLILFNTQFICLISSIHFYFFINRFHRNTLWGTRLWEPEKVFAIFLLVVFKVIFKLNTMQKSKLILVFGIFWAGWYKPILYFLINRFWQFFFRIILWGFFCLISILYICWAIFTILSRFTLSGLCKIFPTLHLILGCSKWRCISRILFAWFFTTLGIWCFWFILSYLE